jgi:hypothetical protein
MFSAVSDTLESSQQASEKMNELADNMIMARNIFVGSLAVYAGYTLLRKYVIVPFLRTYRFLRN